MAARNAASTLDAQVECVLSQRGVTLELLICDDASTDNTFTRMGRWAADPRVRLFRNRKRLHQAATRNRLLAVARGRFCSACDADDLLMPGALSSLAQALDHNPGAGLAFGTLLQVFVGSAPGRPPRLLPAGEPAWDLFENRMSHGGGLMRTDLVLQVGGYDPSLRLAEDWDLMLRLRERAGFVALRDRLTYVWRIHDRSLGRIRRARHEKMAQIVLRAARRRLALGLQGL